LAAALALEVVGRTVARVSAVKKGETKEMTLATAGFVSQDMLTDPFFAFMGESNQDGSMPSHLLGVF
jgi:hypothetical protein